MRIWVDADAAPRDVKEIVYRASRRLDLPAVLVANQRLSIPLNHPTVSAVWVQGGPDEADRHIAENASPGDIAHELRTPLTLTIGPLEDLRDGFHGALPDGAGDDPPAHAGADHD